MGSWLPLRRVGTDDLGGIRTDLLLVVLPQVMYRRQESIDQTSNFGMKLKMKTLKDQVTVCEADPGPDVAILGDHVSA